MANYNSAYTGAQIDAAISKANSATQPSDLATVATTGAYADLTGKPTLGTAAATASTDYATAAQGALADSAVQPGDDANTMGSGAATDGYVLTADGAGNAAWEAVSGGGTAAGSSGQLQYNNGGIFAAADLWQATNTIEQRKGANAQTFNLYNTYTDASNFERAFMRWSSNELQIGAEAGGTGASRNVRIVGPGGIAAHYISLNSVGGNDIKINAGAGRSVNIAYAGSSGVWINSTGLYSVDANISLGRSASPWNGLYASGTIVLSGLPTTDPASAGRLWNDAGTLKISAG